ncbi:NUDIX hydrolase [Candidatus Saccharibacteria bacterium]|nr:MAG: NUDIX hydrolase [Candidatus Saccharibacteria bacterium]
MATAARAIILQDNKILVMRRNKQSGDYYTLVGGRIQDGESPEEGLVREVKEETGLDVTSAQLVFTEEHRAPYNEQLIFLCEIIPREDVALQEYSEEAALNRHDFSIHEPLWVPVRAFSQLPFRTPQLQAAITKALSRGFPDNPIKL